MVVVKLQTQLVYFGYVKMKDKKQFKKNRIVFILGLVFIIGVLVFAIAWFTIPSFSLTILSLKPLMNQPITLPSFEIINDSVVSDDERAYISITPHTLGNLESCEPLKNQTKGCINLTIVSKQYSGDVDVVFGFNEDISKAGGVWLYSPYDVTEEESYTCDKEEIIKTDDEGLTHIFGENFFNFTSSPKYAWCWRNKTVKDGEVIIEEKTELLFEHSFLRANLSAKTIYWNKTERFDYKNFTGFNKIDYEYSELSKWYIAKDIPMIANETYTLLGRVDYRVGLGINGKYGFGIKRSADTLQEAIQGDNFYWIDPWWNSTFERRINITFNNSLSSENLINFPVLVVLNSSIVNYSETLDDGADIRFVDADESTTLDFDIELWNESGESFVWVEVPQINSGSTTDFIQMFYNNNTPVNDAQDVNGVWDSHYINVFHLSEDPSGGSPQFIDKTSTSNDGVNQNLDAGDLQKGPIGNAIDFDGVDESIQLESSFDPPQAGTVEMWVNPGSFAGQEKRIFGGDDAYEIRIGTTGNQQFENQLFAGGGSPNYLIGNTGLSASTWVKGVFTYNFTSNAMEIFLDDTIDGTSSNADDDPNGGSAFTLNIGRRTGSTPLHDGLLDEVRISDEFFSADWINATFFSESNIFNTFSAVDNAPPPTSSIDLDLIYPTGNVNVTQNEFFNVSVNVTCRNGNCGEINVSLDPWWNTTFNKRINITFDNSASSENLTDFPVLVVLNSSRISYSDTLDDGADIRFLDSDDSTILSHEIEIWNESGDSFVWVKVPLVENTTTDYIWMYYENSSIVSDGQNVTGVWNDYGLVYHFNKDGGINDSTSNNNDVTSIDGSPSLVSGEIGGAWDFNGAGDRTHTTTDSSILDNTTGQYTWEFFVNVKNIADYDVSWGFGDWIPIPRFYTRDNSWYLWVDLEDNDCTSENIPLSYLNSTDGIFHHVVIAIDSDSSSCKVYSDAVEIREDTFVGGNILFNSADLCIGGACDGTDLNQEMDEFRIMVGDFYSTDRVVASNETFHDTFNTYGTEESSTKSGLVSTVGGTIPFYTNESNPRNITLNQDQSQVVVFWVNATGTIDSTHEFFVFANETSNMSINNITSTWNVTIVAPAGDTEAPKWFNNQTNSTLAGTSINHSVNWTDNSALEGYVFSFDNGTGSFVNDSYVTFTGTQNFSNVVKNVNTTGGSTIRWIIYANDTSDNLNATDIFNYTTTSGADDPPKWFDNSTNSTLAGQSVEHRVRWTDETALDGYIFSFCNGTYVTAGGGGNEINWSSSHIAGTFSDPNNALGVSDGTWTTDVNGANPDSRYAMENPTGSISGTQNITVLVRPEDAGAQGDPTIVVELFENGVSVRNIVNSTTVDNAAGNVNISGTFDASEITDPDDVEIRVDVESVGGGPNANTLQMDSIRWNITLSSGGSGLCSEASPTFTNASFVSMIGTNNWSNVSMITNSTVGSTIKWRIYANDSTSNWNATEIFVYNTTGAGDSCTYVSGDWIIQLEDNCVISDLQNASGSSVIINGTSGFLQVANGGEIICKERHFTPTDFNGDSSIGVLTGGLFSCRI